MEQIENLKKEVDEIKNSLNKLKNNVSLSDFEKKNQAENLKAQAEATKQRIEIEINNLDNETKTEAQNLLNKSMDDITSLYNSIVNTTASKPLTENKNIFTKTKDWIWKQRYDIRDKKKWENETWKNILRITWFIASGAWAITLAYKWVKKLWNRAFSSKEEKKEHKGEKIKKKRSFRDKWYWKIIKRASIATATWWWVYGISKRLWWDKESPKNNQHKENNQKWWDTISDAMFQQLLYIEWNQDFVAKTHGKKFWENFVTWPYGMVYKHIDNNWNLLDKPITFKNGERVSKDWAEKNARAYYNKRAKERSDLLKSKWYEYTQDMLDALVSASWWTEKSVKILKEFVLSHWDDKDAIFNFMSKFATTAAWNWKTMPGLVIRRDFEANWFKWNKEPMSEYQRRYYA